MAATMIQELFRTRELDDFPGPFARRARQVAQELRVLWDHTCRTAAEGRRIDTLHSARDDYRALLQGHLRLLKEYLTLAELHQKVIPTDSTWVAELNRAVDDLTALHDELFPRWQTVEDLRQILIEKLALPTAKLRELADKYPPPASWVEETIDPFSD